jgi:Na+-transporting methylmalonyl-CoA/oxaloacetate decarboxylase gamma subunit
MTLVAGGLVGRCCTISSGILWEDGAIEQVVVDEGIRLTLVGIGTAFALLLLLTLVVALMGVVVREIARTGERSSGGAGKADTELRDRALAAVVGVGIMRARASASAAGDDARSDLV